MGTALSTAKSAADDVRASVRERYWHTDAYKKCDGRWQVVWSQATGIVLRFGVCGFEYAK